MKYLFLPSSSGGLILHGAVQQRHSVCLSNNQLITFSLSSSGGGLILDRAVELFSGITVFAPVMNGAGGNLVAIQVLSVPIELAFFVVVKYSLIILGGGVGGGGGGIGNISVLTSLLTKSIFFQF